VTDPGTTDIEKVEAAVRHFVDKAQREEAAAVHDHAVSQRSSDEHSGFARGMSYAAHVLSEMFGADIGPVLERENTKVYV